MQTSTNNMRNIPLVPPKTYWNVKSIYDTKRGEFKAVNTREWLLLRLGIEPIEIAFMDDDTIFFLISEFYCLSASMQWNILSLEHFAMFDDLDRFINRIAVDPYKKQVD